MDTEILHAGGSDRLGEILSRAEAAPKALSPDDLEYLLSLESPGDLARLYSAARSVKLKRCGRGVAVRGLVEAGNACAKDCYYCGIRKSNGSLSRYALSADEIATAAETAKELGYSSLVIQSGEIESEAHTRFIEEALRRIAPLGLGVTLSLGEQTEEVYARWRKAGAARYLLRIETSNPRLYAAIHPPECSWERRVECLKALRRTGYQVGTGVMCALPGQTCRDLAADIRFYGEIDADMIGMGPYIPHPDTPLAAHSPSVDKAWRLAMGLKMIAATRLYLHDVNIAAATALQALADDGREQGVAAGANVLMPNVTDVKYRRNYQLYAGKPCLGESSTACRSCLDRRLESIGETILYGRRGDSRHYASRHAIDREEALALLKPERREELRERAHRVTEDCVEKRFDFCAIINARSGRCSENCKWCAQSAHWKTGCDVHGWVGAEACVAAAKSAAANGADRIGIVTSGRRLSAEDVDNVCAALREMRRESRIGLCASLGLVDEDDLRKLKAAGLERIHCNIETAPSLFPSLCSTHTVEEKLATLRAARRLGFAVCCGGIIGMGETDEQLVEFAFALKEIAPDSIPVNVLHPIEGTPLGKNGILDPERVVDSVALLRLVNPSTPLRFAGGRRDMSDETAAKCIYVGMSAGIAGPLLTTPGGDFDDDRELALRAGYTVSGKR